MDFVIHHTGKAGEAFSSLPMARLLKEQHPGCRVTWVILDLYREALGNCPYIDRIETIPTYSCRSMADVGSHIAKHKYYVFNFQRSVTDQFGLHIDAYYNYIVFRKGDTNTFRLSRAPFYTQFFRNAVEFCPGADEVNSWSPPEWHATDRAIEEGEIFEKRYGGGPVIIISPYVADKMCPADNMVNYDLYQIFSELRKWGLPVISTGTQWDEKVHPGWVVDGYASDLSLGGLFYLIKNRAALVVTPNSGIGFAAHWLGAPTLMIDNRTGWKEQVEIWKQKVPNLEDEARPDEYRWPPFMKENFYQQHLLKVPFEQIEWNAEVFLNLIERFKSIKRIY